MPILTIGVPAHNEESSIARTLKRLEGIRLPASYEREIIVCSNGSTDNTSKIVKDLRASSPNIKLIEIAEKSKIRAYREIERASNSRKGFIVYADADALPRRNSILKLVETLENKPDLVVASGNARPMEAAYSGAKLSPANIVNSLFYKHPVRQIINGQLFAIRREWIRHMADVGFPDDPYMTLALGPQRFRVVPSAVTYVRLPQTLREVYRYRLAIKRGLNNLERFRGEIPDFDKRLSSLKGEFRAYLSKLPAYRKHDLKLHEALIGLPLEWLIELGASIHAKLAPQKQVGFPRPKSSKF